MNINKNIFSWKKCSLFREIGTPIQETRKCRACTYSYRKATMTPLRVKTKSCKYILKKDLGIPYKNLKKSLTRGNVNLRNCPNSSSLDAFRTMSELCVKIVDDFKLLTILTS